MRPLRFPLVVSLTVSLVLIASVDVKALEPEELPILTQAVTEMCATPTKKGEHLKVEGELEAGALVFLRFLKADAEGKVTYEQWEGINAALDKYATDPRKCAIEVLRILVPAFLSTTEESDQSLLLRNLTTAATSLQNSLDRTEDYINRLKKYPEKYDRVGRFINTPICFAEIDSNDGFNNIKNSLFPSAAYSLLGKDNPVLIHITLYDQIHEVLVKIGEIKDKPFLICNSNFRACLLCRPSNLLSAFLYKLTIRVASFMTNLQIQIIIGKYDGDNPTDTISQQISYLECEFFREVKDNVSRPFVPRPIANSVARLASGCG